MGKTKIEWVLGPNGERGETVNPIRFRNLETGKVGHYCEKLSPGCKNCYASAMQKTYLSGLEFTAENRGKGELFFDESQLERVVRRRKPTGFFWCDMTDLFGKWVPDEWIDECFATMAATPQHLHYVLSKRADRMLLWFRGVRKRRPIPGHGVCTGGAPFCGCVPGYDREHEAEVGYCGTEWPLRNVWIGVSVEDRANKYHIDFLRETPAALRFLSFEPLLEDLGELDLRGISLVIDGGESGPNARPAHPDWFRSIRDQCQAARVAYFHKQNGEWLHNEQGSADNLDAMLAAGARGATHRWSKRGGDYSLRVDKRDAGRLLDGVEHNGMPEVPNARS